MPEVPTSEASVLRYTGSASSDADRAAAEVGGWHIPKGSPADFVSALHRLKPRALLLKYELEDVEFLREFTELEFLYVDAADPAVIESLPRLRALHMTEAWKGSLDLSRLPALEWLDVGEPLPRTKLDGLLAEPHPRLRSFAMRKYPFEDLSVVARTFPNLEALSIGQTSKLTSVDGLRGIASTLRSLRLYYAAKLESLQGLEDATALEALDLESLKRVVDLTPLASLPRLRYLRGDLSRVASVKPLAGHPSLEAIYLYAKVDDKDPAPLFEIPNLLAFDGWLENFFPADRTIADVSAVPGLVSRFFRALPDD